MINNKLVLVSTYFYKPGKEIEAPKNGLALFGKFYSQKEHSGNLIYTKEERAKRNNQMFLDCLFKYLRSNDKDYLDHIDKYSRL